MLLVTKGTLRSCNWSKVTDPAHGMVRVTGDKVLMKSVHKVRTVHPCKMDVCFLEFLMVLCVAP